VIGAALVLTGCAGGSGSPSASKAAAPTTTSTTLSQQATIHEWARANDGVIQNVVTDVNALQQAEAPCTSEPFAECLGAVGAACSGVAGAVEAAQGAPSVPDSDAETLWTEAMSDYAAGAQECTTSVNEVSTPLFEQSVQEMAAAKSQMLQLQTLAGATPS